MRDREIDEGGGTEGGGGIEREKWLAAESLPDLSLFLFSFVSATFRFRQGVSLFV